MQYFLYNGVHIEQDIPEMITGLRHEFPQVRFTLQPTLENDPALERLIVDRLLGEESDVLS
jgi:sirohydrochlorin cobaltochelatase